MESSEVEGKRVLIDHCIREFARYAGERGGRSFYVPVEEEGMTGAEREALFEAEHRDLHAPSG